MNKTSLPRYLVTSLPRYLVTSLPRYLVTSLLMLCLFACSLNPENQLKQPPDENSVSVEQDNTALTSEEKIKLDSLLPGFRALVDQYSIKAKSKGITQSSSEYGEGLFEEACEYLKQEMGEGYEKYYTTGVLSIVDNENINSRAVNPPMSYVQLMYHGENNLPFSPGMYYFNVSTKFVKMPWGSWAWGSTSITTTDGNAIGGAELSYVYYSDKVTSAIVVENKAIDSNGNGAIDRSELVTSLAKYSSSITWGFFPKIKGINVRYSAQHPMLRSASHGNGAGLPGGDVNWTRGYYDSGFFAGDF